MSAPSESTQMTSVPGVALAVGEGVERGATGDGQEDVRTVGDERVGVGLAGAGSNGRVRRVEQAVLAWPCPSRATLTSLPLTSLYLAMPSAKPSMKTVTVGIFRPP